MVDQKYAAVFALSHTESLTAEINFFWKKIIKHIKSGMNDNYQIPLEINKQFRKGRQIFKSQTWQIV